MRSLHSFHLTRLLALLSLLLAIATPVTANGSNTIIVPEDGWDLTAGKPAIIEWSDRSDGTVTLSLSPASGNRPTIPLGTNLTNTGSATVEIPSGVPTTEKFQVKIVDDSDNNIQHISTPLTVHSASAGSSSDDTSSSTGPTSSATGTSNGGISNTNAQPSDSADPAAAGAENTTSNSSSASDGLSTGVIAAIAISVVLGNCIVAGAIVFMFWRHRKQKKQRTSLPLSMQQDDQHHPRHYPPPTPQNQEHQRLVQRPPGQRSPTQTSPVELSPAEQPQYPQLSHAPQSQSQHPLTQSSQIQSSEMQDSQIQNSQLSTLQLQGPQLQRDPLPPASPYQHPHPAQSVFAPQDDEQAPPYPANERRNTGLGQKHEYVWPGNANTNGRDRSQPSDYRLNEPSPTELHSTSRGSPQRSAYTLPQRSPAELSAHEAGSVMPW